MHVCCGAAGDTTRNILVPNSAVDAIHRLAIGANPYLDEDLKLRMPSTCRGCPRANSGYSLCDQTNWECRGRALWGIDQMALLAGVHSYLNITYVVLRFRRYLLYLAGS